MWKMPRRISCCSSFGCHVVVIFQLLLLVVQIEMMMMIAPAVKNRLMVMTTTDDDDDERLMMTAQTMIPTRRGFPLQQEELASSSVAVAIEVVP